MGAYFLLAAMFAAALQAEAPANETPAQRLTRVAPPYPEACKPAPGESAQTERVVVAYNVTAEGRVEKARVRETTNSCFAAAALAAARRWSFKPRLVGGKAQPQEDLETTLTFVLDAETAEEDFDARPLVRVLRPYPGSCMLGADKDETVLVQFDVTKEGTTENVSVAHSTNRCFNSTVLEAVKKWEYAPKTIDGEPVARPGVYTAITFSLTGGQGRGEGWAPKPVSTKPQMRKPLFQRLQAVEERIRDDAAYVEQAFDDLALIDEEFGGDYRYIELGMFHQVRAQALIKAQDFAGAIDDLRAAKNSHTTAEGQKEINDLIAALEKILASQDARAAAVSDTSGSDNP